MEIQNSTPHTTSAHMPHKQHIYDIIVQKLLFSDVCLSMHLHLKALGCKLGNIPLPLVDDWEGGKEETKLNKTVQERRSYMYMEL